jgi:predicted permease
MPPGLKFALRALRKTPGLSAVAVLCLAVAIGLSTAAFTVMHAAFLSPLPVQAGDRFVMVHEYHRLGRYNLPMSSARFTFRREHSRSFDDLGAWYSRNITISDGDGATGAASLARAAYVSPNALALLGINPQLGRLPEAADAAPGQRPVVVLGDALWRARFGGREAVLGQPIRIAGIPHRVIGIMPPGVRFPIREDLWIPADMNSRSPNATSESLTVFGRLARGVTADQAETELAAIGAAERGTDRATAADPATATDPVVMPFTRGFMSPEQELSLYGFMFGLIAFLAVTAANLANLFLARNVARAREIALHAALGASRRRLVHLLFLESLLLAGGAALGGLVVAKACLTWFVSQVEDLPWWADFSAGAAVLSFLTVAALAASIVAGITPAMRLTRGPAFEALKSGGSTATGLRVSRTGAVLLAAQLAVSVGFLSVVGVLAQALFGFSYHRYQIAGEQVLIAQVYMGAPPQSELSQPGALRRDVVRRHYERSMQQFERIRSRLLEHGDVRRVTYASQYPGNDVETVRIELDEGVGAPAGGVLTRIAEIGPGFFEVLGTRTVFGRDFSSSDRTGPAHSVIVNMPFARKYFGSASPLGRRIRLLGGAESPAGPWLEIVGVVPDLGLNPADDGRADGIYVPFQASSFARLGLLVDGEPTTLIPRIHEIVRQENAAAQIQAAQTLESQMRTAESVFRGLGGGLLLIGGTALLLSAVSFYSLVSFSVTRRTREIGIRLAVGASRGRILHAVLRRELRVILWGTAAGVALGTVVYRLVTMIPFDLRPAGVPLFAAALGLILFVGVGACVLPARRAMRIQPVDALRYE